MAYVERNTVVRDSTENDGGSGLLVALLFLGVAAIVFFVWAANRDNVGATRGPDRISVEMPDINVQPQPQPAAPAAQ